MDWLQWRLRAANCGKVLWLMPLIGQYIDCGMPKGNILTSTSMAINGWNLQLKFGLSLDTLKMRSIGRFEWYSSISQTPPEVLFNNVLHSYACFLPCTLPVPYPLCPNLVLVVSSLRKCLKFKKALIISCSLSLKPEDSRRLLCFFAQPS